MSRGTVKKIDIKKTGRPSLHDGRSSMPLVAFRLDRDLLAVLDRLVAEAAQLSRGHRD